MQVLLAPVLLDLPAERGVSIPQFDSGPTSNDLLESLIAKSAHVRPSDPIDTLSALLAQNDGETIENRPAAGINMSLQAAE
jgi:hypothetical protein